MICVSAQDDLVYIRVTETLVILQASAEKKRVNTRRPFPMVTKNGQGGLEFVKSKIGSGGCWIVILEIIAGVVILIFGEDQDRILRTELVFGAGIPFNAS